MPAYPDAKDDSLSRLIDLGHLASGVGHHVINAFSTIVSSAELLQAEPASRPIGDRAALSEAIIRTALNAATVARRLIDYTRPVTSIEPDRAAFEPCLLDLAPFLAELVESARRRYPSSIRWAEDYRDLPPLRGHPVQLACMFQYLLDNAVEAIGPEGGSIAVAGSLDERGWIALEFSDSGEGMTPGALERAVEPFFSTKPGHLGVGLSIAHGIWRRHRGTMALRSAPGEGTRIRLCVEPSYVRS